MNTSFDVAITGAGIIGLATGMRLLEEFPGLRVAILEKENMIAAHQTGHNSGVIHSGLYYRPGSLKSRLCISGHDELVRFCREHNVEHEICGKVVLATRDEELPALAELYRRGSENGVLGLQMLSAAEVKEFEPHARCIRGLRVPGAGIVDFRQVAKAYADVFGKKGGELFLGAKVKRVKDFDPKTLRIETGRGVFQSRVLINCAGLYSDHLARSSGLRPPCRIVPFRGEYYRIKPGRAFLVKNLIYPTPDPGFPFLGVHFTRMIDGRIEAGPNAVLAFAREGYSGARIAPLELLETLGYEGFWRLISRHWKTGMGEMMRSFSKSLFTRALQELVPAICAGDLERGGAGVRAQALGKDGKLLDDFVIQQTDKMIHVLNAPSPAATSSLAIAKLIVATAGEKIAS
ncbi:MAG: L-2-hydroxyglutarate oxidase [Syntrophobacteraceae bacterium]|jgi:L-2-hydroxyglutarate oxidase LhgO